MATIKDRKVAGLDGRTTGSQGYQISQTIRKRTEQIFGWMKTVGGMRRSRYCGVERTDAACKWLVSALKPVALGPAERFTAGGRGAGVASSGGETPGAVLEMTQPVLALCRALGLKEIDAVAFPWEGWLRKNWPSTIPTCFRALFF